MFFVVLKNLVDFYALECTIAGTKNKKKLGLTDDLWPIYKIMRMICLKVTSRWCDDRFIVTSDELQRRCFSSF